MAQVRVRELKARLSEHLRRAQVGERFVITERGDDNLARAAKRLG